LTDQLIQSQVLLTRTFTRVSALKKKSRHGINKKHNQ